MAAAGTLVAPAMGARWDPNQDRWITECSGVPPYNSSQSVSGFQPWAGPANGNGNFYGIRSGDPYYIAYVDPQNQVVHAAVWQPWYDGTPHAGGLVQGPFMVDMSVTVDRGGARYCNTNHNVPPAKTPVPVPRVPESQPAH